MLSAILQHTKKPRKHYENPKKTGRKNLEYFVKGGHHGQSN